MDETAIKIENLTFFYNTDDEETAPEDVLAGVSLTIEKGSFVAVLGHNGSGKSALWQDPSAILWEMTSSPS